MDDTRHNLTIALLLAVALPCCAQTEPDGDADAARDATIDVSDVSEDRGEAGEPLDDGVVSDVPGDSDGGTLDARADVAMDGMTSEPTDAVIDVHDSGGLDALDAATDALDAATDALDVATDARDAATDVLDVRPSDVADAVVDLPDSGSPDARGCTSVPWRTTRVGGGGDWGGTTAIALDPMGSPHIVFHTATYGSYGARQLFYASLEPSGSWASSQITMGTGNDRDDTTDLVFDSSGAPHVVYPGLVDGGPHPTMHATRSAGRWTSTPLRGGNTWASIAIDRTDTLHVVSGQDEINYARRPSAGTWSYDTQRGARCMHVAASASGTVHLSFATSPPGTALSELFYATRTPAGVWQFERVESLGVRVGYVCETFVGLGPAGEVHLVYTTPMGLRHALRRPGGAWTMQAGPLASSPSMTMDASGGLHIAYGRPLMHAYLAPGGAWQTNMVDSRPSGVPSVPSDATSIVVDATGMIHIASYDASRSPPRTFGIYYTTGRVCPP